ncbi:Dihydroorotate dehydrogenase B (NAD(+)), electron transfer subunit [subsurface metagenome]
MNWTIGELKKKVNFIYNIKAKILTKEEVAPDIFLIKLLAPSVTQEALPGQFIHIKCGKDNYPLLRRPLSIHRIDKEKGEIFILFQIMGEGTKLLTDRIIGDDLDIMGPIGNGFNIYPESRKIMIVGGGIGVAPLLALCEESIAQGKEVQVLIGALRKELVIGEESFKILGAKVDVATDDGSYQSKGLVTDLLERIIKEGWLADQIFACGPKPILRKINEIALKVNIDYQVSLEERMACGIGACLGCVCKIKTKDKNEDRVRYEYKKVCVDGPVFRGSEVVWDD